MCPEQAFKSLIMIQVLMVIAPISHQMADETQTHTASGAVFTEIHYRKTKILTLLQMKLCPT